MVHWQESVLVLLCVLLVVITAGTLFITRSLVDPCIGVGSGGGGGGGVWEGTGVHAPPTVMPVPPSSKPCASTNNAVFVP